MHTNIPKKNYLGPATISIATTIIASSFCFLPALV
jgi:hypothetical protein